MTTERGGKHLKKVEKTQQNNIHNLKKSATFARMWKRCKSNEHIWDIRGKWGLCHVLGKCQEKTVRIFCFHWRRGVGCHLPNIWHLGRGYLQPPPHWPTPRGGVGTPNHRPQNKGFPSISALPRTHVDNPNNYSAALQWAKGEKKKIDHQTLEK